MQRGPDKYLLYSRQFKRLHLSLYNFPGGYGLGLNYYPKISSYSRREFILHLGTLNAYVVFGRKEFDDAI